MEAERKHGRLARWMENARQFSYEHSNAVEGMFLSAYSAEQALLVVLTYAYQAHIGLIISLFVITAFFTFGVQKLIIEAKNKYLDKKATGLTQDNELLINYVRGLEQENIGLRTLQKIILAKGLNRRMHSNIKGEKND